MTVRRRAAGAAARGGARCGPAIAAVARRRQRALFALFVIQLGALSVAAELCAVPGHDACQPLGALRRVQRLHLPHRGAHPFALGAKAARRAPSDAAAPRRSLGPPRRRGGPPRCCPRRAAWRWACCAPRCTPSWRRRCPKLCF
jgi:hypothetical protein